MTATALYQSNAKPCAKQTNDEIKTSSPKYSLRVPFALLENVSVASHKKLKAILFRSNSKMSAITCKPFVNLAFLLNFNEKRRKHVTKCLNRSFVGTIQFISKLLQFRVFLVTQNQAKRFDINFDSKEIKKKFS